MRWTRRSAAARPQGRRRRRTWLLVCALAVLVLVAGGFGLYRMITPSSAAVAERTVSVTTQTVRNTVSTTGTLEPKQQADLSFSSGGTVTTVDVSVGQKVRQGRVMATIDDTTLRANVDAAKADLQAAKDNLTQIEDTSTSTTAAIQAANSQVALKQSSLDQAVTALAAAKLRATISGTVAQVNIAKGDQVGSTSNSGGQNSAVSGSGSSRSGSSGSGSGGSGNSGSGGGSTASTGADITVISPNSFLVDTSVGSADLPKIKKGLQAEITPTGATQPIYGTVSSVGVMASTSSASNGSTTATFPITIDVTEDQKGLFAGASATVSIIVEQRDNVLTVPTAALTTSGGQTVVQKLVNKTLVPTVVTVGGSYGALTEVTKGLAPGDQVAITFGRTSTGTASGSGQNARRTGAGGAGGFGAGGFGGAGGGGGLGNGGGGFRNGASAAGGGG